MDLALVTLRSAASFRNQSDLIHKCAIEHGWAVKDKEMADVFNFPRERYDRLVALIPLWARYVTTIVRLTAPWFSKSHVVYGPVDGPYQPNENLKRVAKNMRIVAVSQWCKEKIEQSGIHVEGVVPHGIDHADFIFDSSDKYSRLKQLRKKHPRRFIFFSNLNPLGRKGFKHLRKACAILHKKAPKKFVVILHTGLKAAQKIDPHIQETPNLIIEDQYKRLPFRQIALKTVSCDAFLCPSLNEGFGLPILEAMAAKRPIVCLDAPAMNELVSSKEAWLYPYSIVKEQPWGNGAIAHLHEYQPKDLADMMYAAMTEKELSKEKAAAAYEKSLKYDYKKVYPQLLEM